MTDLTLVLGNKAYSSWSLRAWLALKATPLPFKEIVIPLGQADTKAALAAHSPTGKVPVLRAGEMVVWESLAILEVVAERFPELGLWPGGPPDRAIARAIAAEMHAGFAALRQNMPMDLKAKHPGRGRTPEVAADIARITEIWRHCREHHRGSGPFLFGRFTNADAMFAPVATRFDTYGVELDPVCQAYVETIMTMPAMREWIAAAQAEPWIIEYW